MPSTKRLTTLAGAAFVGAAATAMFAAPAMAWHAAITGTPTCDTQTGTWTVSWSVDNTTESSPANITIVKDSVKPAGSTATVKIPQVAAKAETKDVVLQTNVPAAAGSASLKLHVEWVGKEGEVQDKKNVSGRVAIPETPCVKVTPSPTPTATATASPTAVPSASGTAGGETSPTPSKSSAAPALPVTGSQTGLYAGGAAVLLGAGAGLFVMARRRRVKFEA